MKEDVNIVIVKYIIIYKLCNMIVYCMLGDVLMRICF